MMKTSTIANGLRVASREMPGLETAAVGLFADTGSRYEPARLNGLAHLFEHMVFKGAGGRSAREISEAIEDVGGELNAATDRDSTSFTVSLMAEHLPLGIEIISDMILRPHFDEVELEREKDVVLQELGEARDTPNEIFFDDLQAAAFPGQAIGRSILGDETSIEAIGVEDLHGWRTSQYKAGSLTLVAAGKVDHDALVDLAVRAFGSLPSGTIGTPEAACFAGGNRVGRTTSDQAHLALGFGGPSALSSDYFAARFFSDIIGGGMSSRLFQEVREERGLAYSVYSWFAPWRDTGLLAGYAATARQYSAAAAQLILDVVAKAALDATQRELDRVRTQAKSGLLMSLETSWGQTQYLARQLSLHGRLVDPAEVVAELDAVTLDQVRAVGAQMLAGPRARATIGFPAVRAA